MLYGKSLAGLVHQEDTALRRASREACEESHTAERLAALHERIR